MNLINGQFELWILTGNSARNAIIKVSNCGRIRRFNGDVEQAKLRHVFTNKGKNVLISRMICSYFKPKTTEDIKMNRDEVDHISHKPKEYFVNDVRNLRWCTGKENSNFEEHIRNLSNSLKGHVPANKGKPGKITSVFGKKFNEHFGITNYDNPSLYSTERTFYDRHGYCRWEVEDAAN